MSDSRRCAGRTRLQTYLGTWIGRRPATAEPDVPQGAEPGRLTWPPIHGPVAGTRSVSGPEPSRGRPARLGRRAALVAGVMVALTGGSLGWVSPASAASTWTPATAPIPAGTSRTNGLTDLACPAAGTCVGVGSYRDSTFRDLPLVETLSGGVWTEATPPLPADAAAQPEAELDKVSCPTPGSCTAIGGYYDSSGAPQAMVETLSGASWTVSRAPLPSGAAPRFLHFTSVSCPAAASCVALGDYVDFSGYQHGIVWTLSAGSWTASPVPLPAGVETADDTDVPVMSCPALGSCVAVGDYLDSSGTFHGLTETLTAGSWTALNAPLPEGVDSVSYSDLNRVSCPTVGSCVAAGEYQDALGVHYMFATLSEGSWTATEAPLPASVMANSVVLSSLTCTSVDSCVAVGGYTDSSQVDQALIESLAAGSWTASQAPRPAGVTNNEGTSLDTLSCPETGSCVAAGGYFDVAGDAHGMIETQSGGSWTAVEPAIPSGAAAHPEPQLYLLACPTVGACVAAGLYLDAGNRSQILIDAQTQMTPPAAPAISSAVPGDGSVTLKWTPVAGADDYRVATSGAVTDLGGTGTTRTVASLANATAYSFTLAAHNAAGWGPPSTVVKATAGGQLSGLAFTPTVPATGTDHHAVLNLNVSWASASVPPSATGVRGCLQPTTAGTPTFSSCPGGVIQDVSPSVTHALFGSLVSGRAYRATVWPDYNNKTHSGAAAGATVNGSAFINTALASITDGATATLSARLVAAGTTAPLAGQAVTLWQKPAGATAWSLVTSAVFHTNASGVVSRPVKPQVTTSYQWRYAGTAAHLAAVGNETIRVAFAVVEHATTLNIRLGSTTYVYGTVAPLAKNQVIYLQKGGVTQATHAAIVSQRLPNGVTTWGYKLAFKPAARGTYLIRAYKPASSQNLAGYGVTLKLVVT
jgi:hypothetical protein